MKTIVGFVIGVFMVAAATVAGHAADQPPPVPADEQPEVLTRGPVNEAFAKPVNLDDQTGLIAPKAPPAEIREEPPVTLPSDDHLAWVPGYWAWDSDSDDYIWISGCWRAVPPGTSWVPGYWYQTTGGWQWVPGFWSPAETDEIEYLPPPPVLTDVDPPGPPPALDQVWVPPCWYWQHGQYTRRNGYWIVPQADWVWIPSHYVWTPRGYVFVKGYWDYPLDQRGVLFAPVRFPPQLVARPGFAYRLSIVVDTNELTRNLFTCPRYSHYYFGDYYDQTYVNNGIFPWFAFEERHTWYDPIYVHTRWSHFRDDPRWEKHERQEYDHRRLDPTLRPPQTYRDLEGAMNMRPASKRGAFEIAGPMDRVVIKQKAPFAFEPSKPDSAQRLQIHAADVRKFTEERRQWEQPGAGHRENRPPSGAHPPNKNTQEAQKPYGAPASMGNMGQPRLKTSDQDQFTRKTQPPRMPEAKQKNEQPPNYDKIRIRERPVADKQEKGTGGKRPPSWRPDE